MDTESSLFGKNLAVIGGGQGWGAVIAKAGRKLAQRIDIIEQDTGSANRDSIIRAADVVFFAAPDTVIPQILRDVRSLLEGKSVLDCATSKGLFEQDLIDLSRDASVCSTHPMVKADSPRRNQNALIMPVGVCAQTATAVAEDIFRTLHMRLCRFPFEQHANTSAVTQFPPHLVQRALLDALGQLMGELGLDIAAVSDVAPANFKLTANAMARVAIQRPDVSAGIIAQGLSSPLGMHFVEIMRGVLDRIVALGADRASLTGSFQKAVDVLDPHGQWCGEMSIATDMQIEAQANFAISSFVLEVDRDKKGLLADISSFLAARGLNMNAIHSYTVERDDGPGVRFTIGLEQSDVNWEALDRACQERGWAFTRLRRNS